MEITKEQLYKVLNEWGYAISKRSTFNSYWHGNEILLTSENSQWASNTNIRVDVSYDFIKIRVEGTTIEKRMKHADVDFPLKHRYSDLFEFEVIWHNDIIKNRDMLYNLRENFEIIKEQLGISFMQALVMSALTSPGIDIKPAMDLYIGTSELRQVKISTSPDSLSNNPDFSDYNGVIFWGYIPERNIDSGCMPFHVTCDGNIQLGQVT